MNFINCLKLDADRVKIEECEVVKCLCRATTCPKTDGRNGRKDFSFTAKWKLYRNNHAGFTSENKREGFLLICTNI